MRFRLFGRVYSIPRKAGIFFIMGILLLAVFSGKFIMAKNRERNQVTVSTPSPDLFIPTMTVSSEPIYLSVHVAGCVRSPGVFFLPAGSLVLDAVEAAGGFTEAADRDAPNLAKEIVHQMKIYIPAIGENAAWEPENGNSSGINGKININTATAEQFMTLPGIGPGTASKIIDYREKNGRFQKIEDIMNISGIKEAKFSAIKDFIEV